MSLFRPAPDASHETSWVQRGLRVELPFDRAHERERVPRLTPSVERRHAGRPMSDHQRAVRALEFGAKRSERGNNGRGFGLNVYATDTRGLHHGGTATPSGRGASERGDGMSNSRRQNGNLGDYGIGFAGLGRGIKFPARTPDNRAVMGEQ